MSRQLKITEDVYQMLLFLKPSPDSTFSTVILNLIEETCPWLPDAFENLKRLERVNPQEAAAERILLQRQIFDDILIDMFIRKNERDEERAIEKYSIKNDPEEKEGVDHLEKYRRDQRYKILFPDRGAKKSD